MYLGLPASVSVNDPMTWKVGNPGWFGNTFSRRFLSQHGVTVALMSLGDSAVKRCYFIVVYSRGRKENSKEMQNEFRGLTMRSPDSNRW